MTSKTSMGYPHIVVALPNLNNVQTRFALWVIYGILYCYVWYHGIRSRSSSGKRNPGILLWRNSFANLFMKFPTYDSNSTYVRRKLHKINVSRIRFITATPGKWLSWSVSFEVIPLLTFNGSKWDFSFHEIYPSLFTRESCFFFKAICKLASTEGSLKMKIFELGFFLRQFLSRINKILCSVILLFTDVVIHFSEYTVR